MLPRLPYCFLWALSVHFVFVLVAGPQFVRAQPVQADALEVTIPALGVAYEGTPMQVQGQAFRVRGLADLSPGEMPFQVGFRRANSQPGEVQWQTATSDASGLFVVEVPIPEGRGEGELVFRDPGDAREITFEVWPRQRTEIVVRTDRRFYEVDERVHAWALVRDALTGAPREGAVVDFELSASQSVDVGRSEASSTSGASGVAYHVFEPSDVRSGDAVLSARTRGVGGEVSVTFGERASQPLFVEVTTPEEATQPGGQAQIRVQARAQTGEPIEGALIEVQVESRGPVQVRSDAAGVATLMVQVPVLSSPFGVSVVARVSHPVHGRAESSASISVARRGSLRVSLAPSHGALMDGVPSEVWLSVHSAAGPVHDHRVTVRGARGFETQVQTNEHGVARFEVRASLEDAAPTADCRQGVYFELVLGDGPGDIHRACAAVSSAPVRASVRQHVALPGGEIQVDIQRRGRSASPVVVQLLTGQVNAGRNAFTSERLVASQTTTGSTVTFRAPNELGVAQIRAFTMGDDSTSARLSDSLLIRPEPHFATARAGVREAGVDVHVDGGEEGWIAVDVRDLAQHGGESRFRDSFLHDRFRRAVLAPESPADHALLASALAPFGSHQEAAFTPARRGERSSSLARDARHRAHEFRLRGVARLYGYVEERLAEDPQGVAEGEGARRRFRADVFGDTRGYAGLRVTPADLRSADPSFSFESAARRHARQQLVRVLAAAIPHEDNVPGARLVSHLIQHGSISSADAVDPWGGLIGFRPRPAEVHRFFARTEETLAFPGPDGRLGTRDDIVDPFGRVVPEGTPYAVASGEDELMRTIALMSAGTTALAAMMRVMDAMTQPMQEDYDGDAVHAELLTADEGSIGLMGIGLTGHGGGSGYGHGAGGLRGRSARAPRVRSGHASVAPMPGSSILGAVRDNLPGTVHFLPSLATDAQGRAEVAIDLPPSASSFLVEVIHWQPNGWRSSANTRFETSLPIAVQASSPAVATAGDSLRVPVRVANSTSSARTLRVAIDAGSVGESAEVGALQVAAGGRARTLVPLTIGAPGDGHLVIRALDSAGGDQLRSSVHVRPRGLRRELSVDDVHLNEAELTFDVPVDAEATLFIESGTALYPIQDPGWVAWAHSLAGRTPRTEMMSRGIEGLRGGELQGRALSVAWRSPELSDDVVRETVEAFESQGSLLDGLWLLGAAPALRDLSRRPALRSVLERFLRVRIERLIQAASEDTAKLELQALASAVLVTFGEERHRAGADEFARRVRRELVRVGSEVWVPESNRGWSMWASAFLAYADMQLGEVREAAALIRTMSARDDAPSVAADVARAMARVVAARLGTARSMRVETGDQVSTLSLERGQGTQALTVAAGDTLRLQAPGMFRAWVRLRVTQPWESATRSPLALEREEPQEALHLDGRAEWTIKVRNRSPRMLRRTEVHIDLPAGSTIEATSLEHLRDIYHATIRQGTLVLQLSALYPGRTQEIPLALRFGAAGTIRGLGVYAFPRERPESFAAYPPQRLQIGGAP